VQNTGLKVRKLREIDFLT